MCLSARCVLVCCCTAGTCTQSHLAGAVLLCRCTVTQGLVGPLHRVCAMLHHQYFVCGGALLGAVLCTALCVPCRTALVGSGQWNFCNALPHCLWAVGSGTPSLHRHTVWGQWAVELLSCTASLPGGSGQCNSCNAMPRCLGALGSGTSAMRGPTSWGDGESCPRDGRCLKSASPAMLNLTAWGQWAVQLLQCTATLPEGSGQRNSCNALPHCLWAVGSEARALHRHTVWAQWAVELLSFTASLPRGGGQWKCCNALPHCLGAQGNATPAIHSHTPWGRWYSAMRGPTNWGEGESSPGSGRCLKSGTPAMHCHTASDSGRCNPCNALPYCLGAVGSGTPAMHCLTAWG